MRVSLAPQLSSNSISSDQPAETPGQAVSRAGQMCPAAGRWPGRDGLPAIGRHQRGPDARRTIECPKATPAEQRQTVVRHGYARRHPAAQQPSTEPPHTERLIPGQHIGIDEHRTHLNAGLGQQREHRGKSLPVDHHHRVASFTIASTDTQVQRLQGFAQLIFNRKRNGLRTRAGAWTAMDRCVPSCTFPWAAADRPPARSVPAQLDAMAWAGVGPSRTIHSRASRADGAARPSAVRYSQVFIAASRWHSKEENVVAGCSVGESPGRARHRWPAADALPLGHLNRDPVPAAVDAKAVTAQARPGQQRVLGKGLDAGPGRASSADGPRRRRSRRSTPSSVRNTSAGAVLMFSAASLGNTATQGSS